MYQKSSEVFIRTRCSSKLCAWGMKNGGMKGGGMMGGGMMGAGTKGGGMKGGGSGLADHGLLPACCCANRQPHPWHKQQIERGASQPPRKARVCHQRPMQGLLLRLQAATSEAAAASRPGPLGKIRLTTINTTK